MRVYLLLLFPAITLNDSDSSPGDLRQEMSYQPRCGIHYRNNRCIGRALVLSPEHRLGVVDGSAPNHSEDGSQG
jgi:hypothetical protein